MADPFVISSYNISTLSESIRSDIIGPDRPVLRRVAGHLFKGDTENG